MASELNGTTVAAKKEAKKSAKYPDSNIERINFEQKYKKSTPIIKKIFSLQTLIEQDLQRYHKK